MEDWKGIQKKNCHSNSSFLDQAELIQGDQLTLSHLENSHYKNGDGGSCGDVADMRMAML